MLFWWRPLERFIRKIRKIRVEAVVFTACKQGLGSLTLASG